MEIIMIKSSTSTIVIPLLTTENVMLDTELKEIDDEQLQSESSKPNVYNNVDGMISITSGMADKDEIIQPIIIPHNYEGTDNEKSLTKIVDYLNANCSKHLNIEKLDFGEFKLSGSIIKIMK